MPSDLFDLEEKVRDYLADLFPTNVPGKLFLAFETFGASLPVEIFRLQPNGPFLPELVIEQLTKLADDVPLVDARDYRRTLRKVAAQYQMLLAGSQSLPDSPAAAVALFEAVKSEAKMLCDNGNRGSFAPEPIPYLPVIGQPGNWYEPSVANWRKVQFGIGTTSPAPTSPPVVTDRTSTRFLRPMQLLRLEDRELASWKMMVPMDAPVPPPAPSPATPMGLSTLATAGRAREGALRMVAISPVAGRPDLTRIRLSSTPGAGRPASTLIVENRFRDQIIRIRPELIAAFGNTAPAPPAPSDSLEIGFEVLAVELERLWLHMPFFDVRNWYVPGYYAGEFNAELLPAIPTGMLLIRNLTITAKGSADDRLAKAVSFGPFELTEKSADVRTENGRFHISIKADGVQIVAWVGQILPPLPPASDPSLPPRLPPQ